MSAEAIRQIRADELEGLLALYAHLHAVDEPVERGERLSNHWSRMLANPGLEI